jgi:hypothetical protein
VGKLGVSANGCRHIQNNLLIDRISKPDILSAIFYFLIINAIIVYQGE